MNQMVIGVFDDKTQAQNALDQLTDRGFNPKDISIIAKEGVVKTTDGDIDTDNESKTSGITAGVTTGGIIGALAGLLVGIGAIAIPGIGAVLIGGPIAAALGLSGAAASTVSGAVTGALAGGLVSALTSIGVPEENARVYEQHIQRGGILLLVPVVDEDEVMTVKDIMSDYNAVQMDVVDST